MAKVIKLKDRQGNVVLPLTRSQLVQVSAITGLDLLNGKTFDSASVQDALEALMSYATTIKQSSDTATTDITKIKSALEGVLDTQRAVVNKIDEEVNAYLNKAKEYTDTQDSAYLKLAKDYTDSKITDAINGVDVKVNATQGSVITGFEIEDGKLKTDSVKEIALTSSNVSRTATAGDHGVAATNVEGAIVELSTKVDTAYTNAEAYTDEKVNALKDTLNGTITTEKGKVFTSITQTNGVLSYTDAALTSSDITRIATDKVAGTTVEEALASLANSIDAGGTGSVVSVKEITNGLADSVLKAYEIWQGPDTNPANKKGTINIPKDLVVTSGSVVNGTWNEGTFTESTSGKNKALKLVIANQAAPVYINPSDFIDVYTGGKTDEVTVVVSGTNEITATIGTVDASKISYNGSNVNTELTNINTKLTAHQNDLTSYNTRISDLETAAAGLSYTVADDSSYISIASSTNGGATTFTISTEDIASDTNLKALQTSYNTMNTELNSGVFYEQVNGKELDDVNLTF